MSDGKIISIKFTIPAEGTDFGQDLPFEVKTENYPEGRVDLRLCHSYRGKKGDSGGNISVTVKNGIAHGKCRIPLHPDWDSDSVEKQKRPLVDFWYVGKIAFEDKEYPGEKIKVPTKESKQSFTFQHLSSSNFASMRITGNCVKDAVTVNSSKPAHFITTKSATDSFDLFIEDHNDMWERFSAKPIKLSFNDQFLKNGSPVSILHTNFNLDHSSNNSSSRTSNPQINLPNGMKVEDTIMVVPLKYAYTEGNFKLSELSNSARETLYECLYGSDVVPSAVAIKESYPILKDFIKGDKFYIKKCKSTYYMMFKGPAAFRQYLKGSRYRYDNPKVALLTVAKGPGAALKSAVQWTEGSTLAMVFIASMDIVEWMATDEGNKYFSDLIVDLSSDAFQAVASTAIGALVGLLAAKITGGTVAIVVGSEVVVAIGVGFLMTWVDNKYNLTDQAKEKVRQCDAALGELVGTVFVKPFLNLMHQLEINAAAAQGVWMP
jgi:hypothetical protein